MRGGVRPLDNKTVSEERGQPSSPNRAYVVLWASIAGLLLGAVILLADFHFWDFGDLPRWDGWEEVLSDGPFLLWAGAICVQPAVWFLTLPVIRSIARRWRTSAAAQSFEVIAATLTLVFLAVAVGALPPLFYELADVIPHSAWKRALINVVGFGLALYAVLAMWYLALEMRTLPRPGRWTRRSRFSGARAVISKSCSGFWAPS